MLLVVGVSLLWLAVVLFVSVLLHELGHALAARAGGYQVTSFGIGSGKPLLLLRLPGSGTIIYLCRFGLRFSGVTWVYSPKGTPSRVSDLLLACGGALTNALIAFGAARVLASFELRSVPFLSVWVPAVVVLLVNSVLALAFFVPHRTVSAEQGVLTSDGLHALAALSLSRSGTRQPGNIAAPLRTLAQKRAFWESIGDSSMLCVALVRAAQTYGNLQDRDAGRACRQELSSLTVAAGSALYQRAWNHLLAVQLEEADDPATALDESEKTFHTLGSRTGVLLATRERVLRVDPGSASDRDVVLAGLQAEAMALGDASLALSLLSDRIVLQGMLVQRGNEAGKDTRSEAAVMERLASQYDAARVERESSLSDIQVYEKIASVRVSGSDDGGAAVGYERALVAARRIYVALAFDPAAQRRFADRQADLVKSAMACCLRLGREADAARYAHLLN